MFCLRRQEKRTSVRLQKFFGYWLLSVSLFWSLIFVGQAARLPFGFVSTNGGKRAACPTIHKSQIEFQNALRVGPVAQLV
jgi:hypothetical protein